MSESESFSTRIANAITAVYNKIIGLIGVRAPMSWIADEFSTAKQYNLDDIVVKDGVLYRCTADPHTGAWNPQHFTQTTVGYVLSLKGGGGGGSDHLNALYLKDTVNDRYHAIRVAEIQGIETLTVDQVDDSSPQSQENEE